MKYRSLVLALALLGSLVVWAAHTPAAAAYNTAAGKTVDVAIDNYAFKAPVVTVAPGTTVVWKNADDDPHTVTADDGLFDSKGLGQGDTFKYTFAKPGRYPYHCSAHPFMKGTIVVKESAK